MKFIQSWWDINKKGKLSEEQIKLIELSRMTFENHLDTKITFYTDLKDTTGLNYSDIRPLNTDGLPAKIWCLGKLVAMAQQTEPFIHLDCDMYLWGKTSYRDFLEPFIVFHYECWTQQYMDFAKLIPAPRSLGDYYDYNNSNNFGIVGGTEWKKLSETAQEILNHVKENGEAIERIGIEYEKSDKLMWTPVLVEQVWMSEIMEIKGFKPYSFLGDRKKNFIFFKQSNLFRRAKNRNIAHFWSESKDNNKEQLLTAYEQWKNYFGNTDSINPIPTPLYLQ